MLSCKAATPSITQRSLLLPKFHFIRVSCATPSEYNTFVCHILSSPSWFGHVWETRQEKLMGGLGKFLAFTGAHGRIYHPYCSRSRREEGRMRTDWNKMSLFKQFWEPVEENGASSRLYCLTYYDGATSSSLVCSFEPVSKKKCGRTIESSWIIVLCPAADRLVVSFFSSLDLLNPSSSLASALFHSLQFVLPRLSSDRCLLSPRGRRLLPDKCSIQSLSRCCSLSFMSPQFFILLLLIFFLEILSIMLFFIYQDEVRRLDCHHCAVYPVIFPADRVSRWLLFCFDSRGSHDVTVSHLWGCFQVRKSLLFVGLVKNRSADILLKQRFNNMEMIFPLMAGVQSSLGRYF